MKRHVVALAACMILFPAATLAQGEPGRHKHSLGANVELSIPVGDFSNVAGVGYGGNARYQYGSDSRTAFTATVGYLVWESKDLAGGNSVQPKAFNFFVGGKYYVAPGFYASLEGGFHFISYTYEGTIVGAEGNTSRFLIPVGIGYQNSGFEIAARYKGFAPDFNSFSFTLGYNFML